MFKTLFFTGLSLLGLAAAAPNIVELAVATPDLSTLVTAVKAGNLTGVLSSPGPFTVFAPTNEAFAKLPSATLNHLLDPKNIAELDAVLTYHVVAGAVHSTDLKPFQEVKSVEGSELRIIVTHEHVYVNHAKVTTANVDASNGVVHIIDEVLIPRHVQRNIDSSADATMNIVELAQATPDLSTLVTAVVAGKLATTLSGAGPFTVFAPTNEAFAKVPKHDLDYLLDPRHIKELQEVLTYHVIAGDIHAADIKEGEQHVKTVEGSELRVVKNSAGVFVGRWNARVTTADVDATNGVVHIINEVLFPRL